VREKINTQILPQCESISTVRGIPFSLWFGRERELSGYDEYMPCEEKIPGIEKYLWTKILEELI